MPTVDSLDIQISAQANKASASLTTLINRLDRVSASLSGVNSRGLATMGSGVNKLSNAMNNFSNNTKTADFSRLARNLAAINTVDTSGFSKMASGISSISSSLANLPNMGDKADQLGTLAKGIAQLGYKSSDKAIHNIPLLASAMTDLMAQLSRAPKVSQNLIDMTNALARLSRTGASSGKAATALGKSFDVYTASTHRATRGTHSLASALGKMYASYWFIFRAFSKIGDSITLASDLTEVQNVVDVTFGDMAYKVEEFAQTSIEQFGMSELTLKQVASQFQAMGTAVNISNKSIGSANQYLNKATNGYVGLADDMSDVSLTLTKLTADMASFYNMSQEDVAEDLQSIFTGMVQPMRTYGIDLTNATLKEWAMTQGLNSNIDAMSQAEKTMLRYQYVLAHTNAAQGDFARTADTWANQIRILKQNFQQLSIIVGNTFINALKPLVKAVNAAMSSILNFATTVYNALGKIFGWKYEVGGGGVTSDLEEGEDSAGGIADGIGEAADNAEKLKKQSQVFDRLNVLTTDTGDDKETSGGTGGGAGGADAGEWVDTGKSILEEFKSEIETLEELGNYIRDALIGAMESIDWDAVYEKARGFGKGLADFLNGLLDYDGEGRTLFGTVGKTLANTLNSIIYAALEFAKTFKWDQLGINIADGINKFFENFDFAGLAETINTWIKGALTTVSTLLTETDFYAIGNKIGEFLSELDFTEILGMISENIKKALEAAFRGLIGLLEEAPIESDLILAFATFKFTRLGTFVSTQIATALAAKLGLAGTFTSVGTVFATALKTALIGGVASMGGIGGMLTLDIAALVSEGGIAAAGTLIGAALIGGIVAALGGGILGTKIYEAFTGEDVNWAETFNTIKESFTDGSWKEALSLWQQDIYNGFYELGVYQEELWNDFYSKFKDGAKEAAGEAKQNWEDFKSGIKETFNVIGGFFSDWWINSVQPWFTAEKWSELWSNVKNFFAQGWNNIVSWWTQSGVYKWYTDKVKPWFTKDKWNFSGIKDGLSQAFNDAVAALKGIWDKFKEWIKDKLSFNFTFNTPDGSSTTSNSDTGTTKTNSYRANVPSTAGLFTSNRVSFAGAYGNSQVSSGMGNTDFERAVETAVSRVLAPYLAEIARNTRETADKEFGVTERAIGKAVQNQNRIKETRTGRDLFGRKVSK